MTIYKMKVWHDYQVTETYEVEVEASSEEEAMRLAKKPSLWVVEAHWETQTLSNTLMKSMKTQSKPSKTRRSLWK